MSRFIRKSIKSRGAVSNLQGRFETQCVSHEVDELTAQTLTAIQGHQEASAHFAHLDIGLDVGGTSGSPTTEVRHEFAKTLITKNQSPDIPFQLSVNPYRGCEHGCTYCFARPSHAYLDMSPGLDFETKLVAKINAPAVFRQELMKPSYQCLPIALGINTDAYQPIEQRYQLTKKILDIASEFKQPISVITKSALILRDIDLIEAMAKEHLIHVAVSVTTLDNELSRRLEPRAASGKVRLKVIQQLANRGISVTAMVAPVIPFINDHELERIVTAVSDAGASMAHYITLRLPHEVAPLFEDWLRVHHPERADRVLNRMRDLHDGQLYRSHFGQRMTGTGYYADLIRQRFQLICRRVGLSEQRYHPLRTSHFRVPPQSGAQLDLFS